MIGLFKKISSHKKFKQKSESKLYVDIHSHLLPGMDDGSKTMFESIKMIKKFQEMGYKKLITTPHIMSHRYKNSSQIILDKLEMLQDALYDKQIDIAVEVASEYYLDEHFLYLLNKKEILTFGKNYLLFELSYTRAPNNLEEVVFDILLAGYTPVLAHPERYLHMHKEFCIYESLKEHGVLFQLNINSLAGYYSKNVQTVAKKLIKKGMIDFLGSDVHKMEQIETLKKVLQSNTYYEIFEKNKIINNDLL